MQFGVIKTLVMQPNVLCILFLNIFLSKKLITTNICPITAHVFPYFPCYPTWSSFILKAACLFIQSAVVWLNLLLLLLLLLGYITLTLCVYITLWCNLASSADLHRVLYPSHSRRHDALSGMSLSSDRGVFLGSCAAETLLPILLEGPYVSPQGDEIRGESGAV